MSLKRMIMFMAFLVILGGALTWGLGRVTPTKISAQSLKSESSAGSLKLVLIIDKTTYGIGERINLTIQIVNISNSTVELVYGTPFVMPPLRFNVSDTESKVIYNSATYRSTLDVQSRNVTLEPDHSFGLIRSWRQWNNALEQVAPGEYHIAIEIIPDALFVFQYLNGTKVDIGTIHIKTPPLTITIST